MLAHMHVAGQTYATHQDNPRGPHWWAVTAPQVMPYLSAENQTLLADELKFQASHRLDQLPRGPIHADLFRDNVLFDGDKLGGFIDFYFAGWDCLLFDVAVCVNDWCITREGEQNGELIASQAQVFLDAYHAVRPFAPGEREAWPVMLRAGALRFWLSRLYDFHLPRAGELITPHDPTHFERILKRRRAAAQLPWV
jgi:homoserine kinase type II